MQKWKPSWLFYPRRFNVPSLSERVVVAMSGGVDSSVAAALLVEQGYQVIGLMLRLWSEGGYESENRCCTPDSMMLARQVAGRLNIPFYAIDAQKIFRNVIVQFFIDGYSQGKTPNPCLACNQYIRWGFLLEKARALGAEYMATGHYARLDQDESGMIRLLKATDPLKDQSYVLHILDQPKLKRTLLPLGLYTKNQVRRMASKMDLPVADKADSQDLCFLGVGNYRDFLLRHAPEIVKPGPIYSANGQEVGQHSGLAFYTIGQRKGLGIKGQSSASSPHYVIAKDLSRNALIIGQSDRPGSKELTTEEVNWIAGSPPPTAFRSQVKIRYKAQPTWALVTPLTNGSAHVIFDKAIRDITPGQAAVFYADEVCLGGGMIAT